MMIVVDTYIYIGGGYYKTGWWMCKLPKGPKNPEWPEGPQQSM